MSLDVFSLNSKRDFNDFIKLPWQIYKGNPYWVPPLISEIKEILDLQKNPFWEHARRELFIARQDGKVVGRIAAIIDDTHNSFHEEKTGFFGFFESVNDQKVANILYDTAKAWLVKGGMTIMRGPASPSLNDECAFLSEGFDLPPTV
ncbi:MAG TPA: hypothetical protein DCZ43_10575, partial [candidate division Zixibacteria bacterium]|nr:hypothetical protein [candidate division Zixibacteria bacterium]